MRASADTQAPLADAVNVAAFLLTNSCTRSTSETGMTTIWNFMSTLATLVASLLGLGCVVHSSLLYRSNRIPMLNAVDLRHDLFDRSLATTSLRSSRCGSAANVSTVLKGGQTWRLYIGACRYLGQGADNAGQCCNCPSKIRFVRRLLRICVLRTSAILTSSERRGTVRHRSSFARKHRRLSLGDMFQSWVAHRSARRSAMCPQNQRPFQKPSLESLDFP
jgi:hypothetical protein